MLLSWPNVVYPLPMRRVDKYHFRRFEMVLCFAFVPVTMAGPPWHGMANDKRCEQQFDTKERKSTSMQIVVRLPPIHPFMF